MLKVSSSLPDIAVIRGGNVAFKDSLSEGADILNSLSKIGYEPVDVLVDKDGTWTSKGFPTDAHKIFSQSHTIVDTTRTKDTQFHHLAKKMGIPLLFSHDTHRYDRETIYRLLRQQDIRVPETFVVRALEPIQDSLFREVWLRFHTPLLIRPLLRNPTVSSKIVRTFHEFEATVRSYHGQGVDLHILTYRKKPTTSIAVLPHFRNEEVYTPLWVDVFPDDDLPNKDSPHRPHLQAPQFKKEHMNSVTKKVYRTLGVATPLCIDFIYHNNEYVVVNIDLNPSLRKEGRFMQSLMTTGVDIGQYVHEYILHDIER